MGNEGSIFYDAWENRESSAFGALFFIGLIVSLIMIFTVGIAVSFAFEGGEFGPLTIISTLSGIPLTFLFSYVMTKTHQYAGLGANGVMSVHHYESLPKELRKSIAPRSEFYKNIRYCSDKQAYNVSREISKIKTQYDRANSLKEKIEPESSVGELFLETLEKKRLDLKMIADTYEELL